MENSRLLKIFKCKMASSWIEPNGKIRSAAAVMMISPHSVLKMDKLRQGAVVSCIRFRLAAFRSTEWNRVATVMSLAGDGQPKPPSIKVNGLNYSFPGGATGLEDVSLDLPPGSRTLLIGGKTVPVLNSENSTDSFESPQPTAPAKPRSSASSPEND